MRVARPPLREGRSEDERRRHHGRLRRLVSAAFKPKAVGALRDATRPIVEERSGEFRRDGGGEAGASSTPS